MKRISIPAQDIGYFRLLLDLALLKEVSWQSESESFEEADSDSYESGTGEFEGQSSNYLE